jgi:hypothetical protein
MVHFLGEMSAAPDQAELAPSRDPAAYGRRPLRRSGALIWVLLCVASLAIGAAVDRFAFPPAAPERTAVVSTEPSVRPTPPVTQSVTAAPMTAPPSAAPSTVADDTALADRVARLEAAASRQNTGAAAALAAASLAIAAEGGAPFDRDIVAYERLAPGDPDLRALVPLAVAGAPSRAALAASLPGVAAGAAVANREPSPDAGFFTKLWAMIGRVVIVRRVDPSAPGLDGALTRAEDQAAAGDLERAVRTLGDAPPAARARLAPWVAAAQRRIEIDQHIASLRARALEALPAPAPAAAEPPA